jgi:hypothetical protein
MREVRHVVTSLPTTWRADDLLARGQSQTETRLYWLHDETLDEDGCQVCSGTAPGVFGPAECERRGSCISGASSNVAALRAYAWSPPGARSRRLKGVREG